MLKTNNGKKLHVLITRPTKKAQALEALLKKQSIACVNQPLFDYQALADQQTSKDLLTHNGIIIFVSLAAVEYAQAIFAVSNWRYQHIVAVGKATKAALQKLGINNILCPQQENSEGLLALPLLNKNVRGKSITIVRGNGGREHLANQLTVNGAKTHYLESYQRVWRTFAKDISKQWHQQQINCIVVTSNALLEKLIELTIKQNNTQLLTNYWRRQCLWIVASQRIADKAKLFGLEQVTVSDGASEQSILKQLLEKR